jgi:membrane protein implicated in regulation of membrane protease activity
LLAAEGFAPDGHFPWLTAVIFAVGVLLVALRSQGHVRVEAIPLLQ